MANGSCHFILGFRPNRSLTRPAPKRPEPYADRQARHNAADGNQRGDPIRNQLHSVRSLDARYLGTVDVTAEKTVVMRCDLE
jgi:hypothetical protein